MNTNLPEPIDVETATLPQLRDAYTALRLFVSSLFLEVKDLNNNFVSAIDNVRRANLNLEAQNAEYVKMSNQLAQNTTDIQQLLSIFLEDEIDTHTNTQGD